MKNWSAKPSRRTEDTWSLLFADSLSAAVLLSFGDYAYEYGSAWIVQVLLKLIVLGVLGAAGTAAAIRVVLSPEAVSKRALLLVPAVWTGAIFGWYAAAAAINSITIAFGAMLITGSIAVRVLVRRWQVRAEARAPADAAAATA